MMKSSTTGQLRDPNITLRTRNAFRISMILLVAFFILFGLFAYLALVSMDGQLFVVATTTFISAVLNVLALRSSRQKQVQAAPYLMIASIIVFCLVITFVLVGVGLILGISSLVA